MRGPYARAAIQLAPAGEVLGISEGLENGLFVGEACLDLPMWAAGSLDTIAVMKIPPIVKPVFGVATATGPDSFAERVTAPRVLATSKAGARISGGGGVNAIYAALCVCYTGCVRKMLTKRRKSSGLGSS